MENAHSETLPLDAPGLKLAAPLDGINGKAEVNGHLLPLEPPIETTAPLSKDISFPESTPDATAAHNHNAFSTNSQIHETSSQVVPESLATGAAPEEQAHTAPLAVADMLATPTQETPPVAPPAPVPAPAQLPSTISAADVAPTEPITDQDIDALPDSLVLAEAKSVPATTEPVIEESAVKAAPEPVSAPAPVEPGISSVAAFVPELRADEAEPTSSAVEPQTSAPEPVEEKTQPAAEAPDVEMEDAVAAPQSSSAANAPADEATVSAPEDTQPSKASDLALEPRSMSNLAIDGSQEEATITADTSMSEAPRSPSKMAREREEDEEDEPAAKRTKVEEPATKDEVHAAAPQPMEVDSGVGEAAASADASASGEASLLAEDGAPKSLADPSLDSQPITPYQNRHLRQVLALVKKTKAGTSFKLPVAQLWPALAESYTEKISNPMDLSVMEQKLRAEDPDKAYKNMGEFKADIDLLVANCVTFNGPEHEVTRLAEAVKDTIYQRMTPLPAVEPRKAEKAESKQAAGRHHEARSQPKPAVKQESAQEKSAARRQSRGAAASPVETAPAAVDAIEAQTFAVPATGVPQIRRTSTKGDNDRPKRPVHPPKSRDVPMEPKKKRKLPPDQKFLEEVLTEVVKPKYYDANGPFLRPVDPVALQIPTYHNVVKKPMDLDTMQVKLQEGSYAGSNGTKSFEADFKQIVKNSEAFNGPAHEVTQQAKKLQDIFEREMAKRDAFMAKHNPSGNGSASASHASPAKDEDTDSEDDVSDAGAADVEDVKDQATLATMEKQLEEAQSKLQGHINERVPDIAVIQLQQNIVTMIQGQIVQQKVKMSEREATRPVKAKKAKAGKSSKKAAGGGGGKKAAGGAAAKKAGGGKKAAKKVMGPIEKEIIAAGINDLDGSGMEKAIDIIKADTSQHENDSGELELDIEQLSNDALTKLYNLVVKALPHLPAEFNARNAPAEVVDTTPAKSGKPKKNKPMGKAEQEAKIKQLEAVQKAVAGGGGGAGATAASEQPMQSIEQDHVAPDADEDSDEESSEEE